MFLRLLSQYSCFVDTALLPDDLRFLSFSRVIPHHPNDHLQFTSLFDHPLLFCSMDTVPLHDILAATCEVPLFRTFVNFFTAVYCPTDGLFVYGCVLLCTVKVFISVAYEEIMQCSQSTVKT